MVYVGREDEIYFEAAFAFTGICPVQLQGVITCLLHFQIAWSRKSFVGVVIRRLFLRTGNKKEESQH